MIKTFILFNRRISISIIKFLDSVFGPVGHHQTYFFELLQNSYDEYTVLEIGGTDRPIFKKEDIGYYIGLDIEKNFKFENFYWYFQ